MYERHNESITRLHNTWRSMKSRCYNKNNIRYSRYGGRGIIVCEEWKNSFISFRNWALENGYADNLTIDRINNNGNYEPLNCRWATNKIQSNNRRTNHYITYKGKTQSLMAWSEELNFNYETVKRRLARGWNINKAFETSSKKIK